jgi:hypothetical protein
MSENKETTSVETVDMNLDDILNIGDSVMLPAGDKKEEPKNSVFSRNAVDLSYLDKPFEKEESSETPGSNEDGKTEAKAPISKSEIDNILSVDEDEDGEVSKSSGRPKLDKAGLVELTNKLIEKNLLVPFDDDKPLDKYTLQDFEELLEANFQEKERKMRQEVPSQFFESLPGELQAAAKYVADGGQDLKGFFKALAAVEEVKSLDPSDEYDQRSIVRSYLQATNFGTPDEIEEEIDGWEDRGELEAKANKFKPKLDALSERQIQYQLQQQEALRQQQAEQAQHYMDSVYKTLEPGDLNGIKLDRKTQNLLFSGLVQPNYPSVSGKQTNLLGHLLEKYQYVEPNHGLLAEALWLLADPDGYKNKVKEGVKKEVTSETVRKLKFEEGKKNASYSESEDRQPSTPKKAGIPRPSQNFFKR